VGILRIKDMLHLILRAILPEKKTADASTRERPDA